MPQLNALIAAAQQRLDQLIAERDQLQANLHAYEGAIQDCRWWLERLQNGDNTGDASESAPGNGAPDSV